MTHVKIDVALRASAIDGHHRTQKVDRAVGFDHQ